MEVDAKVTAVHMVAAVIAGYASYVLSSGLISAIGKNEVLAVLLGLIILYIAGNVSERLFGKEEVGGFKGWLWSGIVPFFFMWLVVWIFIFNFSMI
ncbi:hypothetical protein [Methanobacterium aggregans]|uniref:EMC6-like membrane protein n=1 Tax=Methanobacterium aggregans TaxID=1615586 RepID=UPI00320D6630